MDKVQLNGEVWTIIDFWSYFKVYETQRVLPIAYSIWLIINVSVTNTSNRLTADTECKPLEKGLTRMRHRVTLAIHIVSGIEVACLALPRLNSVYMQSIILHLPSRV